jgi:hypothetical protein
MTAPPARQFDAIMKNYESGKSTTMSNKPSKNLATAANGIHLKAHKDNNVEYRKVSIAVLIQYLFDEYGDITPINL